jgi:hypothetical protein
MEKVVLGIVDTPEQAANGVARLQAMGFEPADVSVLFPDRKGTHDFGFESSTKWPEGALTGATIGFVIGAALGAVLGLGLLAAPGLAIFTAVGPVISALAGAAILALVLGVLGVVVGATVPEIEAKHYAGKVSAGSILVGVHVADREEVRRAREVLRSVAASTVKSTGEAAIPASARAREA